MHGGEPFFCRFMARQIHAVPVFTGVNRSTPRSTSPSDSSPRMHGGEPWRLPVEDVNEFRSPRMHGGDLRRPGE